MQKSMKRQAIWLQNTDSALFESAYFILRPEAEAEPDGDLMLREAERIVAAAGVKKRGRGAGRGMRERERDRVEYLRDTHPFRRGFLTGAGVSALLGAAACLAHLFFS